VALEVATKLEQSTHPELTGGIIATSSPSWMVTSLSSEPLPGESTYSKFTVTRQLSRIFCRIPGYLASRIVKRFDNGSGASKISEFFAVYEFADAKYSNTKWPAGIFVDAIVRKTYVLVFVSLLSTT